jgi:nucleoside-diphosphate-sugar epimerase
MHVMITGGTGFIGGVGARRLLARGDSVVILARSPARAKALEALGATIVPGDLLDPAAVARAAEGCDAALHAAGVPRPASWRTFRAVHIEGTRNVLAAAKAAGLRRVVNIASQAVLFDGRDFVDVDESWPYPRRYIDPYSATKAEAERLALAANSAAGLEVTSLRPAVVWGRGDTTILPIMVRLALSPVGVPACGDGTNLEATTHIENLAGAMLAALTAPAAPGRAYFITDSFRTASREFMARQLEAAGVRPRFLRVPRILAEPAAWMLDHTLSALRLPVPLAYFAVRAAITSRSIRSTRAAGELGYHAHVGLEEGLADLRAWVAEIGGARALVRGAGAPR